MSAKLHPNQTALAEVDGGGTQGISGLIQLDTELVIGLERRRAWPEYCAKPNANVQSDRLVSCSREYGAGSHDK